MKIKVQPFQTILDIAIQYTGSVDNAMGIAIANHCSVTDDVSGLELIIPDAIQVSRNIVRQYSNHNINPATMVDNNTYEGIGYWVIGVDFIIS